MGRARKGPEEDRLQEAETKTQDKAEEDVKNKNLWVRGTVKEFLNLTDEDEEIIERRLEQERGLVSRRSRIDGLSTCGPKAENRFFVVDSMQCFVDHSRLHDPNDFRASACDCRLCGGKRDELPEVGKK